MEETYSNIKETCGGKRIVPHTIHTIVMTNVEIFGSRRKKMEKCRIIEWASTAFLDAHEL